ncbi:hypothetical protein ABPG74_012653 [Tetrahymena malaccensis]
MSTIYSISAIDRQNISIDVSNSQNRQRMMHINNLNDTVEQIIGQHLDELNDHNQNQNSNRESFNDRNNIINIINNSNQSQHSQISRNNHQVNQLQQSQINVQIINQPLQPRNQSILNNNRQNQNVEHNEHILQVQRQSQQQQQNQQQQLQQSQNQSQLQQSQQQIQQRRLQVLSSLDAVDNDAMIYQSMETYDQWFNHMIANQAIICLTIFLVLSSFSTYQLDPIFPIISISVYFLLDIHKLLKQLKKQYDQQTQRLLQIEIFEDMTFLLSEGVLYAYFRTHQFSFMITIGPIFLACVLRYWIYMINKKQNECISFIDFLIITFRIFIIIQIINVSLKISGDIDWSWSEVFWVYWVFFSIVCGLIFGLFMMSLTKFCQVCQGQAQMFEFKGIIWMFYTVTSQSINSCFAIISIIDALENNSTDQIRVSVIFNFAIGLSQFIVTAILNTSIKQFIKQIVSEDTEQDEAQRESQNQNIMNNLSNNNGGIILNHHLHLLNIRNQNNQNRQQNQQNPQQNQIVNINLFDRRNHQQNNRNKVSKPPEIQFKRISVNILPKFLIKFSNTYFKQYSESKMQSVQNSHRKSEKDSSQQQVGAENINNNQNNNDQIDANQNDQISSSSRKKYDAVAAESLATQLNQCQGIKDLEVITLQNEDKIIIFEESDDSASKKSQDDKENNLFDMNQLSENVRNSKESKQNKLENTIKNIPAFEIQFPASMKLIDLPSIQKIRSEINSARLEQKQQKEDISEQSTAKGERQKSNRQQIHQFRKQECNFYLKSCQSSFREKETEKEKIPSLTNQKSIECIQIENIQPPSYEHVTVQNQDQKNINSVENDNIQADQKINEECKSPSNQDQQQIETKQENNNGTTIKKEQIKEEEEQNCLICFQNSQDSVFMNCGHGGICYDCSLDIWKITGECYLCREKIKQILQIDLEYKKQKNLVKILYITELTEESESDSDSESDD